MISNLSKQVRTTYEHISAYIHQTPVLSSSALNQEIGSNVWLKCENFQKVGAFKFRGACNAVFNLEEDTVRNGVATHSSGNHGQAIAKAANLRGIPAYIVMPKNAPKVKIDAVKGYGGEIIFCESNQKAREETLTQVVEETGATFIHPYDNQEVILGQSTAAWELLHEYPQLDLILTPVGGGGLLSGTILAVDAFRTLHPNTQCTVIGTEPEQANDAYRSVQSGKIQPLTSEQMAFPTIADGLRTHLGILPFTIIQSFQTQIACVSEESIVHAMRYIWERFNIIIEASCAVPIAALLEKKITPKYANIGVIITGGNVDLDSLPWNL
jgi:threonine dehydratase